MISPISTAPASSDAIGIMAGDSTTAELPADRVRRDGARRALVVRRELAPDRDDVADGLLRRVVLRRAAAVLVPAARRVRVVARLAVLLAVLAVRLAVLVARLAVLVARRRVELVREPVPRAA